MRKSSALFSCSSLLVILLEYAAPVSLTYTPEVQAAEVNHCVILRARRGGGQELHNRCNGEVEVTWCEDDCSRYDNQVTIRAGGSYPVGDGHISMVACAGRNSVHHYGGTRVKCE